MKIGLAQINTTVGDLAGNTLRILDAYRRLVSEGAELVVFPEMVVTGYPPRDLLFKSRFVADNLAALEAVAEGIGEVPAVVGFVEPNIGEFGRRFFNSAAWCVEGKVRTIARKCLLPTYDVFDEDRYFSPAPSPAVVEHRGQKIALTICEDIWSGPENPASRHYTSDPVETLARFQPDLLVNLSASPWHRGKEGKREAIVARAARRCGCPVVYVNAVGGNDELIFDGRSLVARADGTLHTVVQPFVESLVVADLGSTGMIHPKHRQAPEEDIYEALVLGLRDYAGKCGFRKALLGLSGGIDSALVAVLAAAALGPQNVIGVSLPSSISSQHSRDDAWRLAEHLGIDYHTIPIADLVTSAEWALTPIFAGHKADVTEENLQARSRGLLLMALSNKFGALLLTTGNKSELAVGYCTLYGDMCGGLAVISDLPKVDVYALARWINRNGKVIPQNTIDKEPSAELRPGQKDQDSLPPYEVLDAILERYVEQGHSTAEIVRAGFEEAVVRDVVRKVDLNEYKRKQAAPGLKISPLAFGVGRRIPIVQKYIS